MDKEEKKIYYIEVLMYLILDVRQVYPEELVNQSERVQRRLRFATSILISCIKMKRSDRMPLDNKAIETLSVNAVKNSIVTSEFLDQFIADNDKEPSWDGFVYIYENKSKQKSNLKGRMPVQVKGTESNDHSKDTISFSMSTVDLRNYLYDGGCMLFVVYIGNCGITNKIYYAELTPVKLRKLIEEAKDQESKTIYLKEFPSDNDKKATIFLNCLQNCQKQASFKEGKLFSLEELEEQGILEDIVIPVSGVGITDLQMALVKNEVYIYAKIKGSSIPQPLNVIPQDIHTQEEIDAEITIEDRTFYKSYSVVKSAKEIVLHYGESFTIKYDESNNTCKMSYKNSNKIRVLAQDLEFMLSYLEKGYFKVNDIKLPLDYNSMDSSNFDKVKEKEHLDYAKRIVKVLDILGCPEDIDIKDMNDEDWRNMNRLIVAFLDKNPIKGLKEDLPPVSCIRVGKLRFIVYLKKCKEKGTYEIYDFFKTEFSVAFEVEDNDRKMLPISQFYILHEDDFLTLNNIEFDVILPSFQKIEHHYETFNRANWFLLELLNAYDKARGIRKEKILKTCKEFSDWISKAPEEELDYQIKTLNVLQTIKRYRSFDIDEIRTLYSIIENRATREDCIVGAYLLLNQQQAAEIHFARLPKEEQEKFKEYPIYHFWKTDKNE